MSKKFSVFKHIVHKNEYYGMCVFLFFKNKKVFKKSVPKQHPPFAALIFGEDPMSEEQNCLTFSLTENVRFQKGQEVQELISISLEPNVTCHEFDQYVILQGTLDCVGEYNPVKLEDEAEPDFYNVQKCAKVTLNENGGTYTFCYSFPIDITVPADRCRDIDELSVDIQSFEYKFQEDGCINVACEFCVNGVYDRAFLENEKAQQKLNEQQNDIVVDEVPCNTVEPQYGYGQQDFQQPFDEEQQSSTYPSDHQQASSTDNKYQDLIRQSPEAVDQNQSFEQTVLDNTGYHPYYSHPQYGEQDWQRQNELYRWSDWDHSDSMRVDDQVQQAPQPEFQVQQEYPIPQQEFQESPRDESEIQASYYQAQEIQQPFYQGNQHPWQPNLNFNPPNYQEPYGQHDQFQQLNNQQNQVQQPVQFQQIEQQQFGDITNFRLNVHGNRDETGYKSIFHDELGSPKGPAFDSVESPELEKFDSPVIDENSKSYEGPDNAEVFADAVDFVEVESVDKEAVYREIAPFDVNQSYEQLVYPFESESDPLADNEFFVEVKREPNGFESEYESQQEKDESPEFIELKRDDQTSQSSLISDIFATRDERSTCLKICIIQRGDSFEKLAQRYSIHPHKIARFNDLQPNAVLEEGSILYIPN